jgi:nucleotide-binding universal stress UspA family protein
MEAALEPVEDEMILAIKTILVPTDFSECSQGALQYAEALARQFGATLHLVHVCHPATLTTGGVDAAFISLPDVEEEMRTAAVAEMSKLAGTLAGIATTSEIAFGSPAACIVAAAVEHGVDLVVMGTHGRGPIMHMVLGNVAERVVRAAPCPVLTVREPRRTVATTALQTLANATAAGGGAL